MLEKNPIFEGDILKTHEQSLLKIKFKDNSILTIGPRAEMEISYYRKKPKRRSVIKLIHGQIRVWVREKSSEQKDIMKVKTKNVSIGVRGTEFLTNSYINQGANVTDILLLEGKVKGYFSSGKTLGLAPGEYINTNHLETRTKKLKIEQLDNMLNSKDYLLPRLLDREGKLISPKNIVEIIFNNDEYLEFEGLDINIEKKTKTKGKKGQNNSSEINIDIPVNDD